MIDTIFLIVCALYSFGLIYFKRIWDEIPYSTVEDMTDWPSVSVLVPARNEEKYIVNTLKSILANHYPKNKVEIIVINDHSEDLTVDRIDSIKESIQLIHLGHGEEGKKVALTKGVHHAKGDLIICTDADTCVSINWVKLHAISFLNGSKLSFGPVVYWKDSWSSFLNLELSSLVILGAVFNQIGKPGMINGCNYSYSKKAFIEVGGFAGNLDVPSGDDEFLLRKIRHKYPGRIVFLKSKDALAETEPLSGISRIINQRRRWASKWRIHEDKASKVSAVFIFLFYSLLTGLVLWSIISAYWSTFFVIGLLIKMLADYAFCRSYETVSGQKVRMIPFLFLQTIYPIYAIFVGLASNFGQYNWRGRHYRV